MYSQSPFRQRHMSDPNNLDLSSLDDLAQEAGQIPLEQLTKSEQVQPWDGQGQHGVLYGQMPGSGWQLGPSTRSDDMAECMQIGSRAVMERTSSYNPSIADSGYVSQPVASKTECSANGNEYTFGYSSSPYGPHAGNDRLWPSGLQTVLTESNSRLVEGTGPRKPAMDPCLQCGRQPKNQSDARSVSTLHQNIARVLTDFVTESMQKRTSNAITVRHTAAPEKMALRQSTIWKGTRRVSTVSGLLWAIRLGSSAVHVCSNRRGRRTSFGQDEITSRRTSDASIRIGMKGVFSNRKVLLMGTKYI